MRTLLILFTIISLAACSYTPDMLQDSYNNMGKQYAKELIQMADYTKEQEAGITAYTDSLIATHRKQHLPVYAQQLSSVSKKLKNKQVIPDDLIENLLNTVNAYPAFHGDKNSHAQLAKFASNITDEQLKQLKTSITEETQDVIEEFANISLEKAQRDSVKGIDYMFSMLKVSLSKPQKESLSTHIKAMHDQRQDFAIATQKWSDELMIILQQRDQADFEKQFVAHMQKDNEYLQLVAHAPAETKANEQAQIKMLSELLHSLNEQQRTQLAKSFDSISETLLVLSKQ